MPPEFALTQDAVDDATQVVAVRGEIDLFTAPDLKATLLGAIESGKSRIVVDLTETTFLDSTALGVLIGAVKRLRSRDGVLTIVNTDPNIAKTFEITGLDQIFTIVPTRDEAVDAVDPARDGRLTIVNVDQNIAKTFEITGLDQIFTILGDRDSAVGALDGN